MMMNDMAMNKVVKMSLKVAGHLGEAAVCVGSTIYEGTLFCFI